MALKVFFCSFRWRSALTSAIVLMIPWLFHVFCGGTPLPRRRFPGLRHLSLLRLSHLSPPPLPKVQLPSTLHFPLPSDLLVTYFPDEAGGGGSKIHIGHVIRGFPLTLPVHPLSPNCFQPGRWPTDYWVGLWWYWSGGAPPPPPTHTVHPLKQVLNMNSPHCLMSGLEYPQLSPLPILPEKGDLPS